MKRRIFIGVCFLTTLGTAAVALPAWWEWSRVTANLPDVGPLQEYLPAEATILYDRNGEVIGELYEERRYVLPIEEIPPLVQNAFIAAEDASFRDHGGIDYFGILRAAWRNADEGRVAQGASTITQQVVRNLILFDRQKTVERKLKEVALAWKVEERFSKDYILYLYLNSIYMGAQSYGVEAAARTYFGKHAADLTLGEVALLAGLPQRPSDYNPYKNLDRARLREKYVLEQMVDKGFVDQAAADAAFAEPTTLSPPDNHFLDNAPHFTEHVRRLLVDQLGEEMVNKGGLRVITTCDLGLQQIAQQSLQSQVTKFDRQSGFRRAHIQTLPGEPEINEWRARQEDELKGDAAVSILEDARTYDAVVLAVGSDKARVAIGQHEVMLSIADHRWIHPQHAAGSFAERIASEDQLEDYQDAVARAKAKVAADALAAGIDPAAPPADPNAPAPALRVGMAVPGEAILQAGDLVKVTVDLKRTLKDKKGTPLPAGILYQARELEGALFSMEVNTGAVRALVGGADFTSSQFNRAIQGRRQVGSTFKPFVYGAAIESKRATAATIIEDAPISIPLAGGRFWEPKDYGDEYDGNMTIAKAVALSKNTALVRTILLIDEGMNRDLIYTFSRKLGLGGPPTGELPEGWAPQPDNEYLCPWTTEWVSSVMCLNHFPARPDAETVKIRDHRKEVKRDTEHYCRSCDYSVGLGSTSLTLAEMVRAYATFGNYGKLVEPYYIQEVRDRHGKVIITPPTTEPHQVIDPGVATVMNFMLQGVVQRGTAAKARELKISIAGKTGTTNEGRDAWFIGMTPDIITGVWVGFDTPTPIGGRATGGKVALPIWMEYMRVATPAEKKWPDPPAGAVEWASINEATGTVAEGGRRYPFLPGTVPKFVAVEEVPVEGETPAVIDAPED